VIVAILALAFLSATPRGVAAAPLGEIVGHIVLTAADGAVLSAPGVRLTVRCPTDTIVRVAIAGDDGGFRFTGLPVGTCSITTELQGFAPVTMTAITAAGSITIIRLHLEATPLRTGVLVTGRSGATRKTPKPGQRRPSVDTAPHDSR